MRPVTHIGQFWSAQHGEVRLLAATSMEYDATDDTLSGDAFDITDCVPIDHWRRRLRESSSGGWSDLRWTYERAPFPSTELAELVERQGKTMGDWAAGGVPSDAVPVALAELDREPTPSMDHLVAPIIPRRALAFGVTYLNSALERETEGQRSDYSYVYRAVKDRGERPELFLKGTSPEHFVGPGGRMALRRDFTNSQTMAGEPCERVTVSAGIEPELAAVVSSTGAIWGYTLANDVSGNRIENETLLYLTQAKYFTGGLVLGPLVWLSDEANNPRVEITTRIRGGTGELLFERTSNSERINAPLESLIGWAGSHLAISPGEVFSTGTDVVPDGAVKVLSEDMTVEIRSSRVGRLRHGAAYPDDDGRVNLDYSRLEIERRGAT